MSDERRHVGWHNVAMIAVVGHRGVRSSIAVPPGSGAESGERGSSGVKLRSGRAGLGVGRILALMSSLGFEATQPQAQIRIGKHPCRNFLSQALPRTRLYRAVRIAQNRVWTCADLRFNTTPSHLSDLQLA